MNQRIQQLAEQVGAVQNVLAMGRHDGVLFTETELERFVGLVVNKCMDIAKYHTPDTEECEYTWLIHDKIQEYFGVEE